MSPTKPLKVAILGYTPHRGQAPWAFEHHDWELWMLNDLYMQGIPPHDVRRVRWFELHPWEEKGPDGKPTTFSVDRAHTQVLQGLIAGGAKVYLQEERPEVPGAMRFPYEAIYAHFKDTLGGSLKYFTNTISFEIALAIMEGATEIGIYGVDMMTGGGGVVNNEYGYQRPSCEYWIAAAEFAGIKVHLPAESDLLKNAFVYGDYGGNVFRKKLEAEHKSAQLEVQQINQGQIQAEARKNQFIGRASAFEQILNTWMPGDNGSLEGRAPLPHAHKLAPPVPTPPVEGRLIQPPGSDGDDPRSARPRNRLAEVATP